MIGGRRGWPYGSRVVAIVGCLICLTACSRYKVIPDDLRGQVNRDLSYERIKASPSGNKGQLVVLGGEVLNATRLDEKTRIEVLALPLSDELVPVTERTNSPGRFYAFDGGKEILDPAALEQGTLITVIGEVTGSTLGQIDEGSYEYPTIRIRDLTKWSKVDRPRWGYGYPYAGGYYWGGVRPYGFFPYYY